MSTATRKAPARALKSPLAAPSAWPDGPRRALSRTRCPGQAHDHAHWIALIREPASQCHNFATARNDYCDRPQTYRESAGKTADHMQAAGTISPLPGQACGGSEFPESAWSPRPRRNRAT